MKKNSTVLIVSALALVSAFALPVTNAKAQESDIPDFANDTLTGDWNGLRTKLFKSGLSLDMTYKASLWQNLSGGVERGGNALDNLDIIATIDGEKALGADGTTFFFHVLNNNGGKPNERVGSNGAVDNIEVPVRAFKLYQAWVQKSFLDDSASVLLGLYDLNSEFYVTDTSGLFLNPTYGIGTEMAATGDNGPSIFPYTSMAARVAFSPTDTTYIQAAILDGVPGSPDHPRGTHVEFNDKDGALLVAEAGIKSDTTGHFAFGVLDYTAKRPHVVTGTPENQHGYYFLADKSLYQTADGQDISGFARVGIADGKVGQFRSNISIGAVASGFIPSRPDGKIGLAATHLRNSSPFMTAAPGLDRAETQVELTYHDQITPWLGVQPDLQYTKNPGTDPALDDAWTAGVRMEINF